MATTDPGVPAVCNLERRRGDTFALQFQLNDADGNAIVDAGFSYKITVCSEQEPAGNSTPATQQWTKAITTNGTGLITLAALSDGEAALTPDVYYYDIEQTDGGGARRTVQVGSWTVKQDIGKENL
jgi:hypothetical protein